MIESILPVLSLFGTTLNIAKITELVPTMWVAGFMRGFAGFGSVLIIIMIFSGI